MSHIVVKHYPKFTREKNTGVELGFGQKTMTPQSRMPSKPMTREQAKAFAVSITSSLQPGETLYLIDDEKKATRESWTMDGRRQVTHHVVV